MSFSFYVSLLSFFCSRFYFDFFTDHKEILENTKHVQWALLNGIKFIQFDRTQIFFSYLMNLVGNLLICNIRLLKSVSLCPKEIPLSSFHCKIQHTWPFWFYPKRLSSTFCLPKTIHKILTTFLLLLLSCSLST